MNKAPTRASLDDTLLYLDCVEVQKERLRAILPVLNDMDEVRELTPNATTLLTLAQHIAEDHRHWYSLREALGLHVRAEGAR